MKKTYLLFLLPFILMGCLTTQPTNQISYYDEVNDGGKILYTTLNNYINNDTNCVYDETYEKYELYNNISKDFSSYNSQEEVCYETTQILNTILGNSYSTSNIEENSISYVLQCVTLTDTIEVVVRENFIFLTKQL